MFSCASVITQLKGNQVTIEYLTKNGFTKPILITNRDGLEISLPSRTITLTEINELVGMKEEFEYLFEILLNTNFVDYLGPDRYIDIIDCEKQVTYKMSLEEYIEYFESFERNKIYNVLSLEISNSKYVLHLINN